MGIVIQINREKCIDCGQVIPYCPVDAIKRDKYEKVYIDQDECVECGTCLRANVCPTGALYWPKLDWPRAIRQAFSAVIVGYGVFDREGIRGYKVTSSGGGRGTSEMKTNDVTGRYREGEVGIGAEFGRPCVGFRFKDVEFIAKKLIDLGVELEPFNPLTVLLNEDGSLKYEEIRNEKVMSAILEMNVKQEKMIQVITELREASKKVDTVISVDIITKCKDEEIPIKEILDQAGIKVRINGKANIGLGRPLIE